MNIFLRVENRTEPTTMEMMYENKTFTQKSHVDEDLRERFSD